MLNHFIHDAKHIYLALGATDFRKQIHSLVALVQLSFGKDPFEETCVFLFYNKRKDSIKVLRFDGNSNNLCEANIKPFALVRRAAREMQVKHRKEKNSSKIK